MTMIERDFLFQMLETPSPSGFEQPLQRLVRNRIGKYADSVETDLHGNVIVGLNTKAARRVMICGHADQIGLMIKHISNEGFLYVMAIGGIDVAVLHGAKVAVHGKGGAIPGVIGRKPIHKQNGEERDKTKHEIEKIFIDIGASSKKEAEKIVSVGDPVTFELSPVLLKNDLITCPGLDNKVGVFVAMETLRLCAKAKLDVALYAVSTVQEELGLRGATTSAYSVDPEVAIAIDVTHSTDSPAFDGSKDPCCKLGGGPGLYRGPSINPIVADLLEQSAKSSKVAFQTLPAARPVGNDSSSIQLSRGGVATGSVGIPNRYMHSSAEVVSLKDVEGAIRLLVKFITSITKKSDFRPL